MPCVNKSINIYPGDVGEVFEVMDPDEKLAVLIRLSFLLEDEDVREEIIDQMTANTDFSGLRLLVEGMAAKRV